jgi:predicted NUDIX family NTP pyrophosphohydrolase
MPQPSAGLLMYRLAGNATEFFLVHPGGPFYAKKDDGVWSIPKGLGEPGEDFLTAAKREFAEETGLTPSGNFFPLGSIQMKSGKLVHAWLFAGEWNNEDGIRSNVFPLEWPPRSGKFISVPEADRAGWFSYDVALKKIHPSQQPFLVRAAEQIGKAIS